MKRLLFVLTLGAALACPALAQSADSTDAPPQGPPPDGGPGGHHDHMKFLSASEKAELKKAHDAAIAANPALGTEETDLNTQMKAAHDSGQPPAEDLKTKMHTFHDQLNAAMLTADPAVAPVLAKMKAHHHDHPDGPPPAPSA